MAIPKLSIGDLQVITTNDEPRVLDLRIAEALEFKAPRQIRELIERNREELERYGVLSYGTTNSSDPLGRGRPGKEYWLNEAQAIFICMRSDAPRSADIREEIVAVFKAWRHGKLIPAAPVSMMALENLFDKKLEPVHRRFDRLQQDLSIVQSRVDDIVPRREFSEDSKRQFIFTCYKRHGGFCPCCKAIKIVRDNGHVIDGTYNFDHWYGPERRGSEDGWIVCVNCNRLLKQAQFKSDKRDRFNVFQQDRKDLAAGQLCGPKRKQRKSGTISHPDQKDLWNS